MKQYFEESSVLEISNYIENIYLPDYEYFQNYKVKSGTLFFNIRYQDFSSEVSDSILEAIEVWREFTGLDIQEKFSEGIAEDDQNSHLFFKMDDTGKVGTALHLPTINKENSSEIDRGDISVKPEIAAGQTSLTKPELLWIFMHEIGHFFGLGHTGPYNGPGENEEIYPISNFEIQ